MNFSPTAPLQCVASIVAVEVVAPRHVQLSLHAPEIARSCRAGQFVHVLPRDNSSLDPLLRRAFSIMAARDEEIDILFRVEGNGTAQISQKRAGATLDVLGPLGHPFDLRLFHVKQPVEHPLKPPLQHPVECPSLSPILVGGGVGVPPLVFLGRTFCELGFKPLMLMGARGAGDLLGQRDFERLHIETRIATDDGSVGHAGRVTDLLEVALQSGQENALQPVIYACGPWPMLRAVAGVAARFNVPCQVSVEENMPCGIGVCNGCVIAMKAAGGVDSVDRRGEDFGRYQRICVTGPALWAHQIDWEVL